MSALKFNNTTSNTFPQDRRSFKLRGNADSYFSIDDARECIKRMLSTAESEKIEQTIEQKKEILSQQTNSSVQQKVGMASVADIFGFDPMVSKQKGVHDRDPDEIPTQYRKYYKILLKLRDTVKKDLSKLTTDNLAISVGNTRSDGTDLDIESFDSEFAISLMSNEQEALTEIEEAIRRIYNGTYGICERTGKPIERQRLMAVPFARFSIEGQIEQEKNRQVEIRRGAIFQLESTPEELVDFEGQDEE